MWELPWWVVLIGAWEPGARDSARRHMCLGKFPDEATERIYVDGMNQGLMCNQYALTGLQRTSVGSLGVTRLVLTMASYVATYRCRYGLWTPRKARR